MCAVYRYRDERGKVVQAPVRGVPQITVRRRGAAWRWRLAIKTLSAVGTKERHDMEGDAATKEQAIEDAHAVFGQLIKDEARGRRTKLVKATQYERDEKIVEVKRDCVSGRFVPAKSLVNNCVVPPPKAHVPWWQDETPVKEQRICYPTRALALRVFKDANQHAIDRAGGMDQVSTDGSWDAVNERFGLRGKRRVSTVREAIEAALPSGKPFCLDRLDLDTLNETRPAQEAGGFRLPDFVEEQRWLERMEQREYAEMR